MNRRTAAILFSLLTSSILISLDTGVAHGAERLSSGRIQYLEWVDLLPEDEREGYLPGPPPPDHGYLDGIASKSFGKFGQREGLDCTGLARRFNPDCENAGQRNMSSAVNQKLDGKVVRLQGYIVPLEVAPDGRVTEFFLAAYAGACIHVPPPPPNQMVHAKVPASQGLKSMYDAYAITGVLRTQGKINGMAASAYTIEVSLVERLR